MKSRILGPWKLRFVGTQTCVYAMCLGIDNLSGNAPLAGQGVWQMHKVSQETGGVLFREYCFGEENSLSLTEFYGELGEFCQKLGEFAWAHK